MSSGFLAKQLFGTLSIQIGLHPNFNELIYQPGKNLSHFKVIRAFHVNNTRMRIFITDHPTDMKKFFDVGASTKRFNAIDKTSLFFKTFRTFKSPCVINKELQRNSEQRAGCARRKVNDALGFFKDFFRVLRHFFYRENSFWSRPYDLVFNPKNRTGTTKAFSYAKEVLLVATSNVFKFYRLKVVGRAKFNVALHIKRPKLPFNYRMDFTSSFCSAMRTDI